MLAADRTLMHESLSTIVEYQNKLVDLYVIKTAEHVYESVHVPRFNRREQHSLLDLKLGILLLNLLELRLLLGTM